MPTAVPESQLQKEQLEQEYNRVVREEIEIFRQKAAAFVAGEIPEEEFRPFRLKHGIYGQRQPGVQMVRVKIPGGMLTAPQVEQLARVAEEFAGGRGHVTTRQNLQYHFVPLHQAPEVMHLLADVGLTNREACYNTVRNVTTCVWSGLAHDEVFDVRPHARKIAFALLRQDLTGNLPRKFKLAFDGCRDKDCIAGSINDIGLRAVIREGRRGFRVVVGGGLGPLPTEAQLLAEFVPAEELLPRCEAIIRVFNKYGNRQNRNMARMKFVLRQRGLEWFKEQVAKEFEDIRLHGGIREPELVPEGFGGYQSQPQPLRAGSLLPVINAGATDDEHAAWVKTNVVMQKQVGYAAVTVRVDQGNLTSEQMRGLARIISDTGDGTLRIDIDQNVILPWIPLARLPRVHAALTELGLGDAGAHTISDVTTCPGAYSCNLALTKAMNMGAALQDTVRGYDDPHVNKLKIKVSGCPNSCGQHWIADFGFYGNARKIGGREVPYYLMLLGGGYDEQGILRFGLSVQSIPARLAPEAVRRVLEHYVANRLHGETFRQYVMRHKVETFRQLTADLAKPAELDPEIYQDWGDDSAYSLQLGRGECAS